MDLTVSLIQPNITWENREANLEHIEHLLDQINKTDLIILPEMFSTGFSMNASKLAEPVFGPSMQWMQNKATEFDAVICGSLIINDKGQYFNRLIWMQPDGTHLEYNKRHLFSMAKEDEVYSKGENRVRILLKGWHICPQVCYDLRFPVWNRNDLGYDLLINVANWPDKRIYAWSTLLKARAIENQAYVIGVNRVGDDENEHYSGQSAIINPMGEPIVQLGSEEKVATTQISREELEKVRKHLPFLKDADRFTIEK